MLQLEAVRAFDGDKSPATKRRELAALQSSYDRRFLEQLPVLQLSYPIAPANLVWVVDGTLLLYLHFSSPILLQLEASQPL